MRLSREKVRRGFHRRWISFIVFYPPLCCRMWNSKLKKAFVIDLEDPLFARLPRLSVFFSFCMRHATALFVRLSLCRLYICTRHAEKRRFYTGEKMCKASLKNEIVILWEFVGFASVFVFRFNVDWLCEVVWFYFL